MSLGMGLFLLLSLVTIATPVWSLGHGLDRSRLRSFAQPAPLLEVFQVNRPPLTPQELANSTSCTIALMSHVFGNSAGMPFQGTYSPHCGTEWDVAVLNLSVVSYGRQFDRLGSVWIGGVEVWRTCTAEPTLSGIHFTYSKDITAFASLLNAPQPVVVDIDNYITGPYNGSFNATLSLTLFNISTSLPRREHAADEILSISKVGQGVPNSLYSLPDDAAAIFLSIPTNTTRLVLDILASGNADEEFWYTNVPDQFVDTFQNWNISFLGQGTFREVVVYLDGNPVAAAWPFEIVFTGGVSPFFWQPIVDYRTFDLPSYSLDLTPFLPLLRNGTHQIRVDVLGQPGTLENWYVTGQLHLWYSDGGPSDVSMQMNDYYISPSANITTTAQVAADNTSLTIRTSASRQNQLYTVEYNNIQSNAIFGNGSDFVQNITQTTYFDSPLASGHFIFDLNVVAIDHPNGSSVFQTTLSQTFHRVAPNALTGLFEVEHAEVTATSWIFLKDSEGRKSNGNTSVSLDFLSPHRLYFRSVRAVELQIVYDYELDNSIGLVLEGAE